MLNFLELDSVLSARIPVRASMFSWEFHFNATLARIEDWSIQIFVPSQIEIFQSVLAEIS